MNFSSDGIKRMVLYGCYWMVCGFYKRHNKWQALGLGCPWHYGVCYCDEEQLGKTLYHHMIHITAGIPKLEVIESVIWSHLVYVLFVNKTTFLLLFSML